MDCHGTGAFTGVSLCNKTEKKLRGRSCQKHPGKREKQTERGKTDKAKG